MNTEKSKAVAALQQMAGPPIPYATPAKYAPPPASPPPVVIKQTSGFAFGFGCTFGVLAAVITIILLIFLIPIFIGWLSELPKQQARKAASAAAQQAIVPQQASTRPVAPTQSPKVDPAKPSKINESTVNEDLGLTALHRASSYGDLQSVKDLIASGEDVNKASLLGWTPLHLAARWGNTEIIKLLIDAGADVNAKAGGYTPLDIAKAHHKSEAVKLLSANAP